MKNRITSILCSSLLATLLATAACGGGGGTEGPKVPGKGGNGAGTAPRKSRRTRRRSSTRRSTRSSSTTRRTTGTTRRARRSPRCSTRRPASQKGRFAQATFNAGLSFQRCNDDKNAKAKFEQVLKDDPKFHHARAQLALYQYKADSNEDAAIGAMQQAVTDAQFQNVPRSSTWRCSR